MKVFVPKHVEGGAFSMPLNVGPFTLSLVQLLIIGLFVAMGMGVYNSVAPAAGKGAAAVAAVFPIGIGLFIAFFKISELTLIPFIGKFVKTNFVDVVEKFQVNYSKVSPYEIAIMDIKLRDKKQVVPPKDVALDDEKRKKLLILQDF